MSFHYADKFGKPALSSITAIIPARRTTAISGPSGAGKSTLADLLLGVLQPTSGRILIDDRHLTPPELPAWRGHVGYVPQEVYLFDGSIRNNLAWAIGHDSDDETLWQALEAASADTFVRNLPGGLDSQVGERGLRLSGGERQRIALARALLRRPDVLILDEATSALDADNERRIHDALERLHGQLTIVIIAHRPSTIEHADHVIVLDQGNCLASGSWEEIREKPDIQSIDKRLD